VGERVGGACGEARQAKDAVYRARVECLATNWSELATALQ
jgi:hypothetical protein